MSIIGKIADTIRAIGNKKANDLEKANTEAVVDQAVEDIQKDTVQLQNAVAEEVGAQGQLVAKFNKATGEADDWHNKAVLALSKGDKGLATQALERERVSRSLATGLKTQVDNNEARIKSDRERLTALQMKAEEAKNKGTELKARAEVAKATENVNSSINNINPDSAFAKLQRAEDNVVAKESKNSAVNDLSGNSLDKKFDDLQRESDVDSMMANLEKEVAAKNGAAAPAAPAAAAPSGADEWHIAH
jgi:phage shock protein A